MSRLFQVGCLAGFLEGAYDSSISLAEIQQHGTIGLGTVNAVDGEMVAVDGQFYRVDAQGVATAMAPHDCSPFALVCHFMPTITLNINHIASLKQLNKTLDPYLQSPNFFYMIRIEGDFKHLALRSEMCQLKAYKPLAITLPALQRAFSLSSSTGTVVATHCPAYASALTIPGYHYHYIDADKKTGGHVFNIAVNHAKVEIQQLSEFHMALFHASEFDQRALDADCWSKFAQNE